jgi:hypothetical protein
MQEVIRMFKFGIQLHTLVWSKAGMQGEVEETKVRLIMEVEDLVIWEWVCFIEKKLNLLRS